MQKSVSSVQASFLLVGMLLAGCASQDGADDNSTSVGALASGADDAVYVSGDGFTLDMSRLGPLHLAGRNLVPDGQSASYTTKSDPYEKDAEDVQTSSVFVFAGGALNLLGPLLIDQRGAMSHVSFCEPTVVSSGSAPPQLSGRVAFTIGQLTITPFESWDENLVKLSGSGRGGDGAKWKLECSISVMYEASAAAELPRGKLASVLGKHLVASRSTTKGSDEP